MKITVEVDDSEVPEKYRDKVKAAIEREARLIASSIIRRAIAGR